MGSVSLDRGHRVVAEQERPVEIEAYEPVAEDLPHPGDERCQLRRYVWHDGQYQVPRPPTRVFSIGVPHRSHGSPARP